MLGLDALPDRFLDKILFEPNTGCWLWMAAKDRDGYGWFHIGAPKRMVYAHRHAYTQLVGLIPPDTELDHLCRVTCCVNPAHLEAVHPTVNKRRGHAPAQLAARSETCAQGHPWTPESTGRKTRGFRRCRLCEAARTQAYRAKRLAADPDGWRARHAAEERERRARAKLRASHQ